MSEFGILTHRYLVYFIIPFWILCQFAVLVMMIRREWKLPADKKRRRLVYIHLVLALLVGFAVSFGLMFNVNALAFAILIPLFIIHQFLFYQFRKYPNLSHQEHPFEAHLFGYVGVVPFLLLSAAICLHWEQFLALFDLGPDVVSLDLTRREMYESHAFVFGLCVAGFGLVLLPAAVLFWVARSKRS